MSEIVGSASSASSGPSPNSSLKTSVISASRSNRLSGVLLVSASSSADDQPADLGFGLRAADAVQAIEVEPVEERAVDALLQLLVMRLADVRERVAP